MMKSSSVAKGLCASCMALGLISCAVLAGCQATAQPAKTPPPPPVTVVTVKTMTLPVVVDRIGTTRALQDVTIRARVKGFLREQHFDNGGNVKKGQLLLVIDEEPYKIQLEQATAQLEAAEAARRKNVASKKPEVAKAKLALSQAQLALDAIEERRERSLIQRKVAPQEDLDKAEAQRKKSAAQVDADSADLEQARSDYQIDIDSSKADVDTARAAVDDAKLNLSYCRMISPIDGRIGELKVKVGNLVGDGQATELVTIQQLDPMGFDIRPAARYLPLATSLLKRGLEIKLTVEGQREHPQLGKAIFIDNTIDATTSTFLVRGQAPNPDGLLLPGDYIEGTMVLGEYHDAVVVPEQGVVRGQEGWRVMIVDAENKVDVVKVEPVDTVTGLRVLESGLAVGQRVIVEGIQLVRQGQTVAPTEMPLEGYLRESTRVTSLDRRFNNKVARVPGLTPDPSPKGEPQRDPANPVPSPKPATPPR